MSERSQDVSSYAVCMWKIHVNLMNDLFHLNLSKSPALCVLGLLPDSMNLSGRQRLWVHLAVMTGCRIILHHLTLVDMNRSCTELRGEISLIRSGVPFCGTWCSVSGRFLESKLQSTAVSVTVTGNVSLNQVINSFHVITNKVHMCHFLYMIAYSPLLCTREWDIFRVLNPKMFVFLQKIRVFCLDPKVSSWSKQNKLYSQNPLCSFVDF